LQSTFTDVKLDQTTQTKEPNKWT